MTSYEIHRIASGRTEAPDSLRDAVQSAAADTPTSRDLALVAAALAPVFAIPPSALPPAVPHGLSESASLGARVLGVGAGKATVAAIVVAFAAGGYGAVRWLGSSAPAAHDIAPAPQVETAPPVPAMNVEPAPVDRLPAVSPRAEGAAAAPAVRPREPARARPAEPLSNRDEETPAVEAPKPEMSEFALVEQARRSVAADPKKALALTEEHQRRFAGGPLSEESDFIAIEAERRLGRTDEARALADRFKKRYPTSMHGQSVTVPPALKP